MGCKKKENLLDPKKKKSNHERSLMQHCVVADVHNYFICNIMKHSWDELKVN